MSPQAADPQEEWVRKLAIQISVLCTDDKPSLEEIQMLIAEYTAFYPYPDEYADELRTVGDKAMEYTGHINTCGFTRCTCGAVDQLKIYRAEWYRLSRAALYKAKEVANG